MEAKKKKKKKKKKRKKERKKEKKEEEEKTSDMLFLAIRAANQRREAMQHFASELHRSMAHHPLNPLKVSKTAMTQSHYLDALNGLRKSWPNSSPYH